MGIIMKLLVNTLAVAIAAYIVPGIQLANIWTAVVLVVVLGVLNFLVKPVLLILTLPINILTLGLFTLVINTLIILLASSIVKGFYVEGFWSGFLFAIVLSIITSFLYASTDN
jgi:putative membrane protein